MTTSVLRNLRLPVLISAVLVLPFLILEVLNRGTAVEDFPIPPFGFLWLLAALFGVVLVPLLRRVKAGRSADEPGVWLGILSLILITGLWIAIVVD